MSNDGYGCTYGIDEKVSLFTQNSLCHVLQITRLLHKYINYYGGCLAKTSFNLHETC